MAEIRLTGKASDFSGIVLKTAARGDLDAVRWLVEQNPEWVRQVGPHGRTMLWEAAYRGRFAVVEYLLDCGADPEQPGSYYTPMLAEVSPRTAALLMKHAAAAAALELRGAVLDFHDACYLGDETHVRSELVRDPALVVKPKPRTSDPDAAMPIYYAVAGDQPEICRRLLDAGPHSQALDGLLLRWAAWRGSSAVLEQLLSRGADPRESGIDWTTPELRALAQRFGHTPDVNAPNWLGFPPLVDACRGNHNQTDDPERVRQLLGLGAEANVKDAKGKTALHRAAQAGFTRIPEVLLQAGADVNAADPEGETPLFDAVRGGHLETIRLLVRAGANLQAPNCRGLTPLQLAERIRSNHQDEMKRLLVVAG